MVLPLLAAGVAAGKELLPSIFDFIDKFYETDEEKTAARLRAVELAQKGDLAQIAVNVAEAQNESLFVSGWRPFIGWVCGVALAYQVLGVPFFKFLAWVVGEYTGVSVRFDLLPDMGLDGLMPVLLGMLGMGGLRTYEKLTGVNKRR